jgi:hypothetical protein
MSAVEPTGDMTRKTGHDRCVKRHTAASSLTVLALASGALGVAAVAASPASAAGCSTSTVSSSSAGLGKVVLSVGSVTVKQGGCVLFHNATSGTASVTVNGAGRSIPAGSTGGEWSASQAGAAAVVATVPGGLLGVLPKAGVGTITVTPKPTPPPVPTSTPSHVAGGGSGHSGGGSGGSGHSGGGSGGSGGSGGGSGGTRSGGSRGSGSTGHKGLGSTHHRGPGAINTGGLLTGGTGFSLPSIPLGTFAHEGLAGAGIGTAPQIAPGIGTSTDASGNPLPLLNGSGAQQMALAGDSHPSSGESPIADVVAGLVVLGTAAGLLVAMRRRRAVDGAGHTAAHRA